MEGASDPAADLVIRYRGVPADWKALRMFISRLAREVAGAPFTVAIVSDTAIRRLNLKYRRKDSSTDVLSFPSHQFVGNKAVRGEIGEPLGDVVISTNTAARAANQLGCPLDQELRVLALHGVLHLMGYDHENDHGQMARAERTWGRRLSIPQTLISRQYQKVR